MKDYGKIAEDLFMQGYNCAQSVFGAFCPDCGIDLETGLKLSSSFGGGMGRMREVCGTVSGMYMALGLIYGYTDPKDLTSKAELYKMVQELAAKFKEKNGTIICRELLGLKKPEGTNIPEKRTESYYHKRPCAAYVRESAEILAKYIEEHPVEEKNA